MVMWEVACGDGEDVFCSPVSQASEGLNTPTLAIQRGGGGGASPSVDKFGRG